MPTTLMSEIAVAAEPPRTGPRRSPAQILLACAFGILAAASLVGVRMAAARIPDGAMRLQLLVWTSVVALLLAIPAARLRILAWITPAAGRYATFAQPLLASALVAAVALTEWLAFHGMPQFPDSFAELFQARILAAGRLWLPSPPRPDLVRIANVVDFGGRWYSQYPIGNPALLTLGIVTGLTWLPAALVALALATGVRALARECASEGAAALALLLVLASPTLVLSTAAGMSQATTAALAAWTLVLALRVRRHTGGAPEAAAAQLRPARHPTGAGAALGAGLLAGLAATVRPLDAAVLALVALAVVAAPTRRRASRVTVFLLGAMAGAVPLLVANARTTGSALRLGYSVLWGAGALPGFGTRGWGGPFGPGDAVRSTLIDLGGLNLTLLEWPVPVLLVLAGILAFRRRLPATQQVLAAYVLVHIAAYFTYWHHDFFYGPRFLVPIVPAMLVLLADGLVQMARAPLAGSRWHVQLAAFGRELLFVQLAAAALLVAWPRLARAGRAEITAAAAIRDAAAVSGQERAVLLVDDGWGSRIFGEMWRLGVGAPAAERYYASADACRLERALRQVERDRVRGARAEAALGRMLAGATPGVPLVRWPDARLRVSPGPLPADCVEELAYDRELQRAPFAPLLWLNDVEGRGVVFWRDPGPARLAWVLRDAGRPVYRVRVAWRRAGGFNVALEPLHNAGPLRLR